MTAYYNELDPYAAQWLRNLIAAGHIALGDVDERSITEVSPDDLRGYTQCHFFAGIGGWSYALRLAGWDDARPVWTGSCPCQPFSAAGKGLGERDERHLWPEFRRLIAEYRPATVLGEQVASRAGREWLARVRADLEELGYAVGAADLCAASVVAPHIRQRLWWVADADRRRHDGAGTRSAGRNEFAHGSDAGGLADTDTPGRQLERSGQLLDGERPASRHDADGRDEVCGVEHSARDRRQQRRPESSGRSAERGCGKGWVGDSQRTRLEGHAGDVHYAAGWALETRPIAATGGASAWSDHIWIPCADGKARRIEPGLEPLAHGVLNRVGRLRAYGNAVVPQVAATFIRAAMGE